jgi:hypothetical protein
MARKDVIFRTIIEDCRAWWRHASSREVIEYRGSGWPLLIFGVVFVAVLDAVLLAIGAFVALPYMHAVHVQILVVSVPIGILLMIAVGLAYDLFFEPLGRMLFHRRNIKDDGGR